MIIFGFKEYGEEGLLKQISSFLKEFHIDQVVSKENVTGYGSKMRVQMVNQNQFFFVPKVKSPNASF